VGMFCDGRDRVSRDPEDAVFDVVESEFVGIVSAGVDVLGCARGARKSATGGVGRGEEITGG
jgi:hypothetical protein